MDGAEGVLKLGEVEQIGVGVTVEVGEAAAGPDVRAQSADRMRHRHERHCVRLAADVYGRQCLRCDAGKRHA